MIIKYSTEKNYCLVHKTRFFTYYLVYKNNKYGYYEKFLSKYYNKTYKICARILKNKNLMIEEVKIDSYEIFYKFNLFLLKNKHEEHYCIMSETLGDDKYKTYSVYKDGKEIKSFFGQRNSATFIISFFDYKIKTMNSFDEKFLNVYKNFNFNNKDFQINKYFSEKEIFLYKRYIKRLHYFYKKHIFDDIYINFYLLNKSYDQNKIFMKIFDYYDKIFGDFFIKVINTLKLKDRLVYFYQYFKYYFSFLILISYIDDNRIKDKTIILYCCVFTANRVKDFLDKKNNYIVNEYISLKEKTLLFIDNNIKDEERKEILLNNNKKNVNKFKKVFTSLI
jgi:hypothetical protein